MSDQKQIRNSTAEFLIFTAQSGAETLEVRFEDETIWLTQKLMAALFDVSVPTISEHLTHIFQQQELTREATVRKFRTVQTEGSREVARDRDHYNLDAFIEFNDRDVLQDAGKIIADFAKDHAETEFEKFRLVQDQQFISDFDREIQKELDANQTSVDDLKEFENLKRNFKEEEGDNE